MPTEPNSSNFGSIVKFMGVAFIVLFAFVWMATSDGLSEKNTLVVTPPSFPSSNAIDPATLADLRSSIERSRTFAGHPCTGNCRGHQAGYDWAQSHLITDLEDCDIAGEHSNSPSFAQGCRSYIDDGKYDRDLDGDDVPQDQDPEP